MVTKMIDKNIAKEAIEETSEVIQSGLKNNPLPFLAFTIVVIVGALYACNMYFSYLGSKEQIANSDIRMSEQNKILNEGFKSLNDKLQIQNENLKVVIVNQEKEIMMLKFKAKDLD